MSIARIFQEIRDANGVGGGRARAGQWVLEFERTRAMTPDPLTGWVGTDETQPQVTLKFATEAEATAYCEREGIPFHVIPPAPRRQRIRTYADNFK